jgi:hypothetical protein
MWFAAPNRADWSVTASAGCSTPSRQSQTGFQPAGRIRHRRTAHRSDTCGEQVVPASGIWDERFRCIFSVAPSIQQTHAIGFGGGLAVAGPVLEI